MRKSTIAVVGALTLGIIAVPTVASASNGHPWLLGRSNAESAVTTVTSSAGTPLSLKAKSGYAPLAVNSTKTVTNLSADRLDGLSSGSFLRSTGKAADADKLDGVNSTSFARTTAKTGSIVHDGWSDGSGAVCPSGTLFVSGGGFINTMGDYVIYAGPDWNVDTGRLIPNSWIVIGDSGVGVSNVTCYSPSGAAIPGAATTFDQVVGNTAGLVASGRGPDLSDTAVAKIATVKDLKVGAPAAR